MSGVGPPRTTGATVAAVAAAVAASVAGVALSVWATTGADHSVVESALSDTVVLAFAVVGAVVVAARPGTLVGWLMLAGGMCWSLGNAGVDLAYYGIVAHPGALSGAAVYAVGGSAVRGVGWNVVTIGVPMVFPDGRLAGPRWRWLPRVLAVVLVGAFVDPLTDPQADLTHLGSWRNPIAPAGDLQVISVVAFLCSAPLSLVAMGGVVAQLVSRFRRGQPMLRQQIILLVAAAALPILALPLAFAGFEWAFSTFAIAAPIAIGFAVLARGLYDLRTAANRTLLWGTLSAVVAATYALVIVGVGALLHMRGATWLPWLAVALIAVVFAPMRDGLQRAANRLTFGRWDEPYDVLAALGQRLEATADAGGLLAAVADELQGLGLQRVAIRDASGGLLVGSGKSPDDVEIPLSAYGDRVGTLSFGQPTVPLRDRDRRLLDDLAGHLGGVLHAHRLTADLQLTLERLVVAREEERRRLRRDLHDGLGPALAGHLLRLDLIAGQLPAGSPARCDVDLLRTDLRTTVLEIRRVVEGLRPPALDELGLTGAVQQAIDRLTAGAALSVSVAVDDLPKLPAAMEVAVFRIVTEAVTNVVRHAGASACQVRIDAADGALRVLVQDDGVGLNGASRNGNGLTTMRERAEELRGRLTVAAAEGTTVVAELPLPPAARAARETTRSAGLA